MKGILNLSVEVIIPDNTILSKIEINAGKSYTSFSKSKHYYKWQKFITPVCYQGYTPTFFHESTYAYNTWSTRHAYTYAITELQFYILAYFVPIGSDIIFVLQVLSKERCTVNS